MAQTLSPLDSVFLSIESPAVHMQVGGVSIFDPSTGPGGTLTFDDYRRRVISRLDRLPRLRQRLSQDPLRLGPIRWVPDAAFDPDLHLMHDALPRPGGERELNELAGWIMSTPLERDRPLWESHFVEGLSGGRVAVIMKAHHAMEDGLAGLRQTELVLDDDPDPSHGGHPGPPAAGPRSSLVRQLVDSLLDLPIPGAGAHRLGTAVSATAGVVDYLSACLLAPSTPLNGELGADRAVATWSAPLEVAKAVHHRLGVSFNDLVLAITAGGLRRYFLRRGLQPPPRVRVMVPVSTRFGQAQAFGNHVSAFLLDLDLGWRSAAETARRISADAHSGRARDEAIALALLEELNGLLAQPLQRAAGRLLVANRLFNLVVSDVRGLERPLSLLGARHLASYPLMPLAPGSGLSIAVLTMGGVLGVAVICEPRLVPDPELLAEAIADAFRELRLEAGIELPSPR
ncbi:MAG TPA: wax ester/triacylglycerol synthase family O-acyltransferase [Solirubrobacterales bacterium]|nr:wax ester/triacylglycerol synthase family O-acyltransferase [Solirubrobacterales bacterium]